MNTIQKNISDALNLENLPLEEQKEMIDRVGFLIYQNVLMRVIEMMGGKDQDEFEKLLDKNAEPEEIFMFLKSKVPNLEEIIKEEAEKLRNKTTNIMDQIGE